MTIKNSKSGQAASPARPRKTYQSPRLVTFGKLHTLVGAGTTGTAEGMCFFCMRRRA
jgi:hypothetical protein